jgi:hypothetical protein
MSAVEYTRENVLSAVARDLGRSADRLFIPERGEDYSIYRVYFIEPGESVDVENSNDDLWVYKDRSELLTDTAIGISEAQSDESLSEEIHLDDHDVLVRLLATCDPSREISHWVISRCRQMVYDHEMLAKTADDYIKDPAEAILQLAGNLGEGVLDIIRAQCGMSEESLARFAIEERGLDYYLDGRRPWITREGFVCTTFDDEAQKVLDALFVEQEKIR